MHNTARTLGVCGRVRSVHGRKVHAHGAVEGGRGAQQPRSGRRPAGRPGFGAHTHTTRLQTHQRCGIDHPSLMMKGHQPAAPAICAAASAGSQVWPIRDPSIMPHTHSHLAKGFAAAPPPGRRTAHAPADASLGGECIGSAGSYRTERRLTAVLLAQSTNQRLLCS